VKTPKYSACAFQRSPSGIYAATAAVPDGHFSLIRPLDDPTLPWLGTLTGVPILGFWYWATNQYITQRVLGAKSVTHAQWGAVFGGALKLIPLFTMVIPGALAISLYPDLQNPDMVFPTLVTNVLPIGVTGLVLAGLIAAIMSSVDSTLNSASTLVVHDFVEPRRPNLTPSQVGNYGRITTIILMVIAALWAPMIQEFGGLFAYLQQAFSILVPPVAAIFLLGVFWRRGTAAGSIWTLVIGHALGVVVFLLAQAGLWTLHFTVNAGIMTAVSMVIFVVVSLITPPPPAEQVAETTWRPELARPEQAYPWYKDYRYQSVGVLVLVALMLAVFW
jgi:SSS family solute:Na+ symporter